MTTEQTSHTIHEQSAADVRLGQVLETYLADLEARRNPDETQLIADNPDIADRLRDCLDSLSVVRQVTPGFGSPLEPDDVTKQPALGDFRLVREIGRGGMGVVYEAEQISLDRRVAVKILPLAAFLGPHYLQRFKQEALAAAVLRHPNIVGVYCVGCERGIHFYAMELIEGRTLADVIQQLRTGEPSADTAQKIHPPPNAAIDTVPIAALSTQHSGNRPHYYRSIARLGIQAAEALEYAHQQGIVHRDIKPANLMLDHAGKVWISDFGLAQAAGNHELTISGDLLGTLRYMSPEQAEGKKLLDHRTDVYSLGVTLYELVTLQPAFSGENRQQLLSQVMEGRPLLLRGQDRSIPTDLETIVRKATATRPEVRYDTAQEFANDLRRFVNNEPIQARPERRWETLRRAATRNPVAAGLAVVAVVLTICLATAGPLAAINYRRLADREREFRHEAVDSRREVQAILERAITGIGEAIVRPETLGSLPPRLFADAAAYYDELLRTNGDDPAVCLEAAVAKRKLGFSVHSINRYDPRAAELYRQALTLLINVVEEHPENAIYAFELAETHLAVAKVHFFLLDLDEALIHTRQATTILERLVEKNPEDTRFRRNLITYRRLFATILTWRWEDPSEAEAQLLLAIDDGGALTAEPTARLSDFISLAQSHSNLASYYLWLNRFQKSENAVRTALRLHDEAIQAGLALTPDLFNATADTRHIYAQLLTSQYRFNEAKRIAKIAIGDLERVLTGHPNSAGTRSGIANLSKDLSYAELATGDVAAAEAALRDAIRVNTELSMSRGDLDQVLRTHFRLGQLLWRANRRAEAAEEFRVAGNELEPLLEKRNVRHWGLVFLTTCPDPQHRDAERAVQLARESLHPKHQQIWRILGIAEYRAGHAEEAISALEHSVDLRGGGDAIDWLFLAMAHAELGQPEAAHQWYRKAADALERKEPICRDVITHPKQLREYQNEAALMLEKE